MAASGSKKLDAKRAARLRRHEMEQQKRQLHRQDRIRTWIVAGSAIVVGVALIGGAALAQALKPTPFDQRTVASFGVKKDKAACTAIQTPKDDKDTVIDGTKKGTYKNLPPVGGPRYAETLVSTVHFYQVADKPKVESLVANEFSGDTVVWYLPSLPDKQVKQLKDLARKIPENNSNFVVAPWDPSYGAFSVKDKPVAITTKGHVQYCAAVSGGAIDAFMNETAGAATPTPAGTVPALVPSGSATATPAASATATSSAGATPAPSATPTASATPATSTPASASATS